MATTSTVYVVMSAHQAAAKLRELVDSGRWGDANKLSYELKAFYDHVRSFAQQRGGHVYVHLYDRSVLDIPLVAAEEFPTIVEEFTARFGTRVAVGMGFSESEAAEAMKISERTGEIQLYGEKLPEGNEDYEGEGMPYELPPNLYDPLNPPSPAPAADLPKEPGPPPMISAEQELQGQQALMQAMFGAPAQSPPPQAPPQEEQEEQEEQRPKGLLESLGHKPKGGSPPRQQAGEESSGKQSDKPEKEEKAEPEASGDGEAASGGKDKILSRLAFIRGSLPEMMRLAESNPKAFNHLIGVVKKLVSLAKSMGVSEYEDLTKQLNSASKTFSGKYPVGTTIKGKKKVLVDGKAKWRGVRSGLVKDPAGEAVSVKSSNAQAKGRE